MKRMGELEHQIQQPVNSLLRTVPILEEERDDLQCTLDL